VSEFVKPLSFAWTLVIAVHYRREQ